MSLIAVLLVLCVLPLASTAMFLVASHLWYASYLRASGLRPAHRGVRLLAYWIGEALSMFAITLWHFLPHPRLLPIGSDDGVVLFVHGWTQDQTNFRRVRTRVQQELNLPTRAVSLGHFHPTLEHYAPKLEAALDALTTERPARVAVVCHSMGGLILRIVLNQRPDLRAHIHFVMTLGTPHHGTAGARYFGVYEGLRQMQYPSAHLQQLPPLADLVGDAELVTMAAAQDYVVYPETSSVPEGTRTRTSRRAGHAGLLVLDESVDQIVSELAAFASP